MTTTRARVLRRALALCLLAALALAAPGGAGAATPGGGTVDAKSLLRSRLLWATIDVCNASDQPDTLGVRGSMPGDRFAHDTMYMRFRLQYLDASKKTWVDVVNGVSPAWTNVGSGASARQGGRSFQLSPVAGQPALTMRGVVSFQWRRGTTVLAEGSRATSAGRQSLAGSDPRGFSAATCDIG